jgi:hypothetical protein
MFDQLTNEELEAELAAQAAEVDAARCRFLLLTAEAKKRDRWGGDGVTFTDWLAWRCSLRPRQAREDERVAGRLVELPFVQGSFSRGELSYAKVSTLTRVAEPENEQNLVELAEVMTAAQLERAVGAYRRVARDEAAAQQDREFVTFFWQDDGSFSLRARLAADDGALVLRALESGRASLRERRLAQAAAAAPEPLPDECRVSRAEAFVAMADLALANPDADRSGGERGQVVVHVDVQTLAADLDGRCELDEGIALAAETARRLTCDGSIVELLERNGEVLSLGRKRRTVSPALRRALASRDRGCQFPGCHSQRFVEAHHVKHWSRGGETKLENLVQLCRRHHRLVHERGYTVKVGDEGEIAFVNHYGVRIPNVPRPPPPTRPDAASERHRRLGLTIDERTCKHGRADPMNLGYAVDALIDICRLPPERVLGRRAGAGDDAERELALEPQPPQRARDDPQGDPERAGLAHSHIVGDATPLAAADTYGSRQPFG